ncbi:hypothetical protein SBRCBS47491_009913 [Sporothrix bragantina]|uniref:Glycosyltransferase family 28 N-terminal domain-containing protein n=1 Tax=Sporothrix bragantina TaxID=671064 RepID=A0ABP0D1H9_9PEZI
MADPSKGLAPSLSLMADAEADQQKNQQQTQNLQTQQTQQPQTQDQSHFLRPDYSVSQANTSTSGISPNASTVASQTSSADQLYEHHSHPHQHQHHSPFHRSHERLFGMMPDDGGVHYEDVNREGRAASVALDKEGHLAYPALVPPAVESPRGSIKGGANDFFGSASASPSPSQPAHSLQIPQSSQSSQQKQQQPTSTSFEGRPKAVSNPPKLKNFAGAGPGHSNNVGILVTAPSGESSATGMGSTARKTKSRDTENMSGATTVRPSRNRSSTMPMPVPAKRRQSDVILIQELRRTSVLHWNLPGLMDPSDPDDENSAESSPDTYDGASNLEAGTAGSAGQQQIQRQKTVSDAAGPSRSSRNATGAAGQGDEEPASSSFWRRGKKHKVFGHNTSLPFLNSQSYKRDGRLPISVKDTSHTGVLAKAVGAAVRRIAPLDGGDDDDAKSSTDEAEVEGDADAYGSGKRKEEMSLAASEFSRVSRTLAHQKSPRLNIVIMVIGSRGDIQPFLKIGKVLKEQYGHRVRVATHPAFRDFIEKDAGLEFFSAGGDPAELMAFMVKNPGMIPSLSTVRNGDIGRRREAMAEMFDGFWRACVDATDDPNDIRNLKLVGDKEPFIADAIIANPPSYVHVHCAEALGIPLHVMFTFPYTPTQAFPHPLANIKKSNVDPGYTNFISYPLIDMMVWQGLGDLVNNFRVKTLDLEPISMIWAPGAVYRMHVPFTYLWSPGLIPKPSDWGPEIDIGGFIFLDLASSFTPPESLERFLAESEEPPIYIGFGSIVVDDADTFTEMIFEAVRKSGVRALVSKGWGGFGGKGDSVPDNIYMLENTPHDWLFPKVRAVVIHGGAGTTAIALKCGLPIMVVPFFGDQYFWGSMIEKSKVGPKPVPYKRLTVDRLTDGIQYLLCDEARTAAQAIAESIEKEGDGAENACRSFMRTLELEGHGSMRCAIFPDRVAVWQRKGSNIKLSTLAAEALVEKGYMTYKNLRLLRHTEWNDFEGPGEPITAMFGSLARSFRDVVSGPFTAASEIIRGGKRSRKERKKKKALKEERAAKKKNNSSNEKPRNSNAHDLADEDTLGGGDDDSSSITLQNSGKAEDGSFEVVFAAVGKSVGRSARALAMAPINLYFSLCQGFHNAPRLYGDDTVRRPPHVTGIKSGMKAAGHEFIFGIYDGFTGIVRLPVRFTRNGGGIHGFIRGAGMGLMGFVLKDICAIIGPLGYVLKGLAKQADRSKMPARYLRRGRMMQAQREVRALNPEEWKIHYEKAVVGWEALHDLYKAVQQGDQGASGGLGDDLEAGNGGGHGDGALAAAPERLRVIRRGSIDSVFQHHHHHHVMSSETRQSLDDLDAALENADLAAIALAAIRRGESLGSIVRGRHSCPRARRSHPCHLCGPPERDLNMACRKQFEQRDHERKKHKLENGTNDDDGTGCDDSEIEHQSLPPTNRPVEREFEKLMKLEELEKCRQVVGEPSGENTTNTTSAANGEEAAWRDHRAAQAAARDAGQEAEESPLFFNTPPSWPLTSPLKHPFNIYYESVQDTDAAKAWPAREIQYAKQKWDAMTEDEQAVYAKLSEDQRRQAWVDSFRSSRLFR